VCVCGVCVCVWCVCVCMWGVCVCVWGVCVCVCVCVRVLRQHTPWSCHASLLIGMETPGKALALALERHVLLMASWVAQHCPLSPGEGTGPCLVAAVCVTC
jgi:hypothetical protein